MNRLSIVMPCHNRRDALRLTLESLCQQTAGPDCFEVLVVDQASTDGSRELVRTFDAPFPLRLVEQDGKYGPSVARNGGVQASSSNFLLMLDADMLADKGLVEAHLDAHVKLPHAMLCGRMLPYLPAYASYIEQIVNPEAGLDRGDFDGPLPFYQGFGGNMVFSREAYTEIGPFEPALKAFEDIDFSYRASRLGIPIYNNPRAVSYHNHPRTLLERFEQARSYNRMLPILFSRYPELKGQIPPLLVYEPISWNNDGGMRILKKIRVRLFSLPLIFPAAQSVLTYLNQQHRFPRLVRFLYWQLLIGNWYLGFREGATGLSQLNKP